MRPPAKYEFLRRWRRTFGCTVFQWKKFGFPTKPFGQEDVEKRKAMIYEGMELGVIGEKELENGPEVPRVRN